VFEDFENRTNNSGCGGGIVTTGLPSGGPSNAFLGISHGTPHITTGCASDGDDKPQGVLMFAEDQGTCGESIWLSAPFNHQKIYTISFDAIAGSSHNEDLSLFTLNVEVATGIANMIGTNVSCTSCFGDPQPNIASQNIAKISLADIPSFEEGCSTFEFRYNNVSPVFDQLWFYMEIREGVEGADDAGVVLDNICITEKDCPDCLRFTDPVADIPAGVHEVVSCIETFTISPPHTDSDFIDNIPTQSTEFIAGDYIHLKPQTHIRVSSGGSFHAYMHDNGCDNGNGSVAFDGQHETRSANRGGPNWVLDEEGDSQRKADLADPDRKGNALVSPNPNAGTFSVYFPTSDFLRNKQVYIKVYDVLGREVYSNQVTEQRTSIESNQFNTVQRGIYLLAIYVNESVVQTERVVIK